MDLEQALKDSMETGDNQQAALDYLNKVTDDPHNFPAVVELFFRIENGRSRLLLSFLIDIFLDKSWSSIDPQLIVDFRTQILDLFFNNEFSIDLSKQIEVIVSNIAFNQWPEVWPNFIGDLLTIVTEINNTNNLTKVFHILSNLVTSFSTSQFISLTRRNLLIQELQFKIPDIISLLQSIQFDKVSQSEICISFVLFIQLYCKLNLDDSQVCNNLASFLFSNFAPFIPKTFEALKNLISKPRIDLNLFSLSIENTIELIEKSPSDTAEFISFICHLIKESISIFPQCCSDQNFFSTIRNILEYTLTNSSKTDFCEDVWSLWSLLLNAYADGVELRTSAVYLMLEPMLATVLESLFELLPTAMSQSRLLSYQPISCIVAFSMIDEDMLLAFLSQKEFSSSLLISIGIIYFLNDNQIFESILNNILPQLISEHFTDDIDVSLFVVSRNTPYLSSHLDFLEEVVSIFTELIQSENMPIIQSFLLALNHIASKIPNVVMNHCPDFIVFCLENLVDPSKFQHDDFLRICRIMSKFVASAKNEEDQHHLSEVLASPVSQLLNETNQDLIILGCDAVNALASISDLSVAITMELLWEPLSVALNNLKNSEKFSIVCDSFSTTIRTCSFERCSSVVSSFVDFAQTLQNQECALVHTFAQIRLCHREMDSYRQMIASTLIQNMVNEESITYEFFEFFDAYEILDEEQSFVIPAACEAIRCFDPNISKSAANLLMKYFRPDTAPLKIQCENEIIAAIFDACFDQMHHQCMKKLLKLLHQVVDKMHKRQIPFEQVIFDSIQNRICDDEFSQKIVAALKNSISQEKMFINLVADLLIAAGRANPNEFQMLSDIVEIRAKTKIPACPFQNEDEIGKC